MNYNPNIHHRRSIRLKGYDYSKAGLYFITICCQNRDCLFGEIIDNLMILNDAGKMIEKWCIELENKFPDIKLGEFIVMPNHFHCIIINNGNGNPIIETNTTEAMVGADLRVCPDTDKSESDETILDEHIGSQNPVEHIWDEHIGSPLHTVMQWFKTMTTNGYIRGVKTLGWKPFDKKIWQRNYHEHIIRNEQSYQTISDYIINNPAKWKGDKNFIL